MAGAFWKTLGSGGTGAYSSLVPTNSGSAPGSPPLDRNGAGSQEKGQGGEHAPLFEAREDAHGSSARPSAPFAAPSLAAALRLAPFGAASAGYAQLAPPEGHHDDHPVSHSEHTAGTRPGHSAEGSGGSSSRIQVQRDRAPVVDVEKRSEGFLQSYLKASEDTEPLPELDPRLYNEVLTACAAPPECPFQGPLHGSRQIHLLAFFSQSG